MTLFAAETKEMKNLLTAIDKRDVDEVRKIILDHPDLINQETTFGRTVLQYANNFYISDSIDTNTNLYKIIKFLIESGADINKKNRDGNSAFLIFLQSISITSTSESESLEKWQNSNIIMEIFKLFLNNGADIHLKNNKGFTALRELFYENFSNIMLKITNKLIKRGINIDERNNDNLTAIGQVMENIFDDLVDETYDQSFTEDLSKMIELLAENGSKLEFNGKFEKILRPILNHRLKEKGEEIAKLKKEIEELRYKPGNPGFLETMENFEDLKKKN